MNLFRGCLWLARPATAGWVSPAGRPRHPPAAPIAMNLLFIVLPSAVVLLVAYFTYGRLLSRLFELNAQRKTPAYELQDGLDFEPLDPSSLVPQHFSAIAAAGPIVGPILA